MKITKEERDELARLHNIALTTPIITMGLGQRDMSSMAWDDVREFMDGLAKKYGYDPHKYAVSLSTCEVVPV